jgi:hypothetical protein
VSVTKDMQSYILNTLKGMKTFTELKVYNLSMCKVDS